MTHSSNDSKVNELVPQTLCPSGCDGYGTYPEADQDGDPTPAQCQYCYEVRFPQIDRIQALINQAVIAENQRYVVLAEASGLPSSTIELRTLHKAASDRIKELQGGEDE